MPEANSRSCPLPPKRRKVLLKSVWGTFFAFPEEEGREKKIATISLSSRSRNFF